MKKKYLGKTSINTVLNCMEQGLNQKENHMTESNRISVVEDSWYEGRMVTVKFYDNDKNLIGTKEMLYGDTPIFDGVLPTKEQTVDKVFTFDHWESVDSKLSLYPVFLESPRKYTVTFMNEDQVFSTQQIAYGLSASNPGTPTKDPVGLFQYSFQSWDQLYNQIYGDIIIHAVFDEVFIGSVASDGELDKWEYTLSGDNVFLSKYIGSDENVVVHDAYTKDSNKYYTKINSGNQMFYNKTIITGIDFNDYIDTSECINMKEMFSGCKKLTSLDLSSFNTSKVTDMHAMFRSTLSLPILDLSSFDTSNVTDMADMFRYSSVESLNVSKFNTSKVTTMNHMFHGCKKLTSLDLSSFNTSKVTDMTSMFSQSDRITSINVSKFNTSKVTTMNSMFYQMWSLISLDLSSFDTSNVTDMTCMFYECWNLNSINLKSFNVLNVTTMTHMFYSCKKLTSLDLSSFNTSKVTDMTSMFRSCKGLTSLDLTKFDTHKVTTMEDMFAYCTNLKEIKVSRNKWVIPEGCNTTDMFKNCGVDHVTYVD